MKLETARIPVMTGTRAGGRQHDGTRVRCFSLIDLLDLGCAEASGVPLWQRLTRAFAAAHLGP